MSGFSIAAVDAWDATTVSQERRASISQRLVEFSRWRGATTATEDGVVVWRR